MSLVKFSIRLWSLIAVLLAATSLPASAATIVGGFAISTSTNVIFMDGDGTTVLNVVPDTVSNVTGLTNGNAVGRIGADVWRTYDASGNIVATRQLDNFGIYNDAAAVGGGGYAAVTNANILFVAADGTSVNAVVNEGPQFVTTLSNGNAVGMIGAEVWRLYSPTGGVLATRVLDNLGVYNSAAPVGAGGYVAVSNSRMVFMGADGLAVNNVLTDVVQSITGLTNGNAVGRIGLDVWRMYDAAGNVLATRPLDNLGAFQGAAAVGGGGYVAYTDTNAIFIGADGMSVNAVVPNALEFVTPLSNGNVVGRLVGTDNWRLFDPVGNILATRALDNLGAFTGAAPTGLATVVPEPAGLVLLIGGIVGAALGRRSRRSGSDRV
jgi:hypothetical protein